MKKYDYIDVLRALAILGVIAVHASQGIPGLPPVLKGIFNYGQLGVQLFFIASAMTLCISMENRSGEGVKYFYIRRFFRIAPLFYVAMVFYFLWRLTKAFIMDGSLSVPDTYTVTGLLSTIMFVHGFFPRDFNFYVPGGWSISTEMMFYLIFPFLYVFSKKLTTSSLLKVVVGFSFVLGVAQFVFLYMIVPELLGKFIPNEGFGFLYASIFNQLPVFLVGILGVRFLNYNFKVQWVAFFLLLNFVSLCLQNHPLLRFGMNGFVYPILSAISFIILVSWMSRLSYELKPFQWLVDIGRNSFSLYICHFFVLDIVRFLLRKFEMYEVIEPSLIVFLIFGATLLLSRLMSFFTLRYVESVGINFGRNIIRAEKAKSSSNAVSGY
jgi:peptidoglycan/LPS O-acetylase OafA/YrhL